MNLIVFVPTQNLIYTNNKQQKYWKLICVSYAKRNIVKLEACLELCFFAHWNVNSNYNATGIISWSTILREISPQCFWQNGFNLYGYCRLFCLNITFYLIRVIQSEWNSSENCIVSQKRWSWPNKNCYLIFGRSHVALSFTLTLQ